MAWKHYEVQRSGIVSIIIGEEAVDCQFRMGNITTGKQRVYQCYYLCIALPDGREAIGEDQHNLRAALLDVAKKLAEMGITLTVAGLDDRFYESGLSHNSGQGYIDGLGRVWMMEPV